VASPEFELCLPGQEPTKFVLVLGTQSESFGLVGPRCQSSFKKAKGCGRVSIKCKGGPLATSTFLIALWLEGDGQARQPLETVLCSFVERSMCEHESWKLQARPDQRKVTVGVQLTVATLASESLEAALTCPGDLEAVRRDAFASLAAAATGLDLGPPPSPQSFEAMGGSRESTPSSSCPGARPRAASCSW
jgi:hypothetical protein